MSASNRCSTCHLVLKENTFHDCPGAPVCTEPGCNGRVFKSRASYHTHMSTYHRGKPLPTERYPCKDCSWSGCTQDALEDHVAKHHTGEPQVFHCVGCGSVFSSIASSRQHSCPDPHPYILRGDLPLVVRVTPIRRPPHSPTCEGHSPEDTSVLPPSEREALQSSEMDVPEAPLCCGGEGAILGVPMRYLGKRESLAKRAERAGLQLPRMGGLGRPLLVPLDMIHALCPELSSEQICTEAEHTWKSLEDLARLAFLRAHTTVVESL